MMRRVTLLVPGLLLVALCSCLHGKVEHQVLERGFQAGADFSRAHVAVVTTAEDFSGLYRRIHSGELPPPQPPRVDFSTSFVLIIAMGEKQSAGHAVEIGKVAREDSRLKVEVRYVEPSTERMQAAVITRPYAVIRIERQPGLESVLLVDPEGNRLASLPLR